MSAIGIGAAAMFLPAKEEMTGELIRVSEDEQDTRVLENATDQRVLEESE